jgi:hypothetical protein
LHPPFLVDGEPPHPPFTFAISVAGFRPRGAFADALFAAPYTTPTLHVLGRTDVIVHEERARTLLDVSAAKRVVWHDGGAPFRPAGAAGADVSSRALRAEQGELAHVLPRLCTRPVRGRACAWRVGRHERGRVRHHYARGNRTGNARVVTAATARAGGFVYASAGRDHCASHGRCTA